MFRLAVAVSMLWLAVAGAHGQSFQTALPLDRAERVAMERELAPILNRAAPDVVRRVTLPSGRVLAVRPYRPVRRPGDEPCRGYRIDLLDGGRSVAVDGFRCRRADGIDWPIREPEIVLAQNGAPLDLRGTVAPSEETPGSFTLDGREREQRNAEAQRNTDEAASASGTAARTEPPPVPRRAPRKMQSDAQGTTETRNTAALSDPATVPDRAQDRPQATGSEPVSQQGSRSAIGLQGPAQGQEAAQEPASERRQAPQPDAAEPGRAMAAAEKPTSVAEGVSALPLPPDGDPDPLDAVPGPLGDDEAAGPRPSRLRNVTPAPSDSSEPSGPSDNGETASQLEVVRIRPDEADESRSIAAVPAPTDEPQALKPRIVEGPERQRDETVASDGRVVAALRALAYLPGEATNPSTQAVRDAIDTFASDERFTLPVSTDQLLTRLDTAIERRDTLPACAWAASDKPCIIED